MQKEKQHYVSLGSAASTGWETRTKVRGTTEIHLAGYPTHIEGREQLTILTPEVGGSVKSETEYAFHIANATKETPAEPLVEEKIQQMETGAKFFTWGREASSESQEAKNEIGKTTIQEQLGELDQVFAAGQSGTPAEFNTLEKIVELIRKDDSAVNAIVERLSRPEEVNTTDRAAALIGMLGAAGTVKAQETLIGMVNTESWPMEQRGMAIFSFAQVNQPAPAVDAWLRQLHAKNDELSNNSLLILGAVGNRVREENPERYEEIADYVISAAVTSGQDINEHYAVFRVKDKLIWKSLKTRDRKLAAAHSEVAPAMSLAFASATLSTRKRTLRPRGL